MKITIHANGVQWQQEYLPRFTDGFAAHGCRVHHTMIDEADPDSVNVIFANNAWKTTMQQCLRRGYPLITVGRCFFGSRFDMVAIGWDGFNGDADFCLDAKMPDDRWQKHGWDIPFSVRQRARFDGDGSLLVCGEFRPMDAWYKALRKELPGDRVLFRPHPFVAGQSVRGWTQAPPVGQDELVRLFDGLLAVVTFDSISGCDAALAGVPSIAYGENSMARPVSWNSWTQFKSASNIPPMEVDDWANRLAYCQWSHDEITKGDFWDHLCGRLDADDS